MAKLCKKKKEKHRCKQRNAEQFAEIATFQCSKCARLACAKKLLCKPNKIRSLNPVDNAD
jgi:ubiquitin